MLSPQAGLELPSAAIRERWTSSVWSLWEVFSSIFRRNVEQEDEESDGFVPSPLDLSVRYSHGGSDHEIDRERTKIEEQAREVEEKQREQ